MNCECGCGKPTTIATRNDTGAGMVAGRPRRFLRGHNVNRFTGDTVEQKMLARIDRRGDDECWPWTGSTTPTGYGSMKWQGKSIYGHRWAYEQTKGPIPEGMHVDHLCGNRGCANPRHLEAVTPAENLRRMRSNHPHLWPMASQQQAG